jgi:CubicO group peptidase (beta-lactamase class C family)
VSDLDSLLLARRVDALLAPWRKEGRPGMAVGVVQDGTLVLHRTAGLASLELAVPVGPDTTFRIASVSKQFTAAAVLLLAREGGLDLEAEARRYLPELPDFGVGLTVAHLLHNTSGIRDMLEIMRQGGVDLGQPISREQLLGGILSQRTLNFPPGSRYLYSNTGFFLLGMMVERIGGQPLGAFLEDRIFAPLGMTRTRFTASAEAVVPGLASGYLPGEGGGWRRAVHGFPLGGEGGLVSSVEDLALWDRNFTTGRVGNGWLEQELTRQIEFTGGGLLGYARGVAVSSHRGQRTVGHGGLWPGYRTEFLRCPGRKVSIICISNDGASDPYHLAHDILDVVLDGIPGVAPAPPPPPREDLEKLVGRWLDPRSGFTLDISMSGPGRLMGCTHGVPFRLDANADGRLRASRAARDFQCALARDGRLAVELDAGVQARLQRVAPGGPLPEGLAGRYFNAEIGATWTFTPTGGTPSGEGMRVDVAGPVTAAGGGWPVEAIDGDVVRIWMPGPLFRAWLDARVLREDGRVSGLNVSGNRARRLLYTRLDDAAPP